MVHFYMSVLQQKLSHILYGWFLYSVHKLRAGNSHKKGWRFCEIIHNYYCVIEMCKLCITFYFIELQCNHTCKSYCQYEVPY